MAPRIIFKTGTKPKSTRTKSVSPTAKATAMATLTNTKGASPAKKAARANKLSPKSSIARPAQPLSATTGKPRLALRLAQPASATISKARIALRLLDGRLITQNSPGQYVYTEPVVIKKENTAEPMEGVEGGDGYETDDPIDMSGIPEWKDPVEEEAEFMDCIERASIAAVRQALSDVDMNDSAIVDEELESQARRRAACNDIHMENYDDDYGAEFEHEVEPVQEQELKQTNVSQPDDDAEHEDDEEYDDEESDDDDEDPPIGPFEADDPHGIRVLIQRESYLNLKDWNPPSQRFGSEECTEEFPSYDGEAEKEALRIYNAPNNHLLTLGICHLGDPRYFGIEAYFRIRGRGDKVDIFEGATDGAVPSMMYGKHTLRLFSPEELRDHEVEKGFDLKKREKWYIGQLRKKREWERREEELKEAIIKEKKARKERKRIEREEKEAREKEEAWRAERLKVAREREVARAEMYRQRAVEADRQRAMAAEWERQGDVVRQLIEEKECVEREESQEEEAAAKAKSTKSANAKKSRKPRRPPMTAEEEDLRIAALHEVLEKSRIVNERRKKEAQDKRDAAAQKKKDDAQRRKDEFAQWKKEAAEKREKKRADALKKKRADALKKKELAKQKKEIAKWKKDGFKVEGEGEDEDEVMEDVDKEEYDKEEVQKTNAVDKKAVDRVSSWLFGGRS